MKTLLVSAVLCALVSTAGAVEWRNIDAGHYLGGRKASEGYLQGKVVMVCLWRADDEASRALLPRIEEIWGSFKTKPLVVLGGHLEEGGTDEQARAALSRGKVTFPVYREAGLARGHPRYKDLPFVYIVDETGKTVYLGRDDRAATQALVTALTDMEAPRNPAQWRHFLDYELDHLPCHGYLRLREFREKFPKEVTAYGPKAKELLEIPNLKDVATLVEFAKRAKDPPVFGPKDKAKKAKYQKLVGDVISKCEPFKAHPDPRVAQEAKNALAELRWMQAKF